MEGERSRERGGWNSERGGWEGRKSDNNSKVNVCCSGRRFKDLRFSKHSNIFTKVISGF